jgi:hypothetical protein
MGLQIPSGIPAHMRESIELWIMRGIPHPETMGRFFRAVLLHDLMAACGAADHDNQRAIMAWAAWLYESPMLAHGTMGKLLAWHAVGGVEGIDAGRTYEHAEPCERCGVRP